MVQRSKYWVGVVLVLGLVLCSTVVSADFSVSSEGVKVDIFDNESAEYRLVIENLGPLDELFQVFTIDPKWLVSTDPSPIFIPAGSSKEVRVFLLPKSGLEVGYHGPPLKIKAVESKDFVTKNALVYIKPRDIRFGRYQPSVAMEVQHPLRLEPKSGGFDVKVLLRNRNALDFEQVTLRLESDLFSVKDTFSLGPLETKVRVFPVSLDPLTPPGQYVILAFLEGLNSTISQEQSALEVLSVPDIRIDEQISSFLFRKEHVFEVRNTGNAPDTTRVFFPAGALKRFFSSASREPILFKNETGSFWVWEVSVAPGETVMFSVVTSYRWLVIVVLLLCLAVLGYFVFRSPVVVVKEAFAKESEEEGVSDVKVVLFIRNRSGRVMSNISIIDAIPSIASYVQSKSSVGTLHPSRVSKVEGKGTVLKWEIEFLDPYEERVISYRISSRLRIMGGLTLPSAKVKFETPSGRERISFSNAVSTKARH
ncbi:hypothetical protein D6783_05580 [Candidatus Woesearchaeota archaeon]|nr:MAG: hypothetical protein D6783_05580 [Candidatus Woesearchaeota archaeon]